VTTEWFDDSKLDEVRAYLLKATSSETGGAYLSFPLALCGVSSEHYTEGQDPTGYSVVDVAAEVVTLIVHHLVVDLGFPVAAVNQLLDESWQEAGIDLQVIVAERDSDL
jgi:hypothetical protein